MTPAEIENICGFCGLPGADKIPHPVRWPGENGDWARYSKDRAEAALRAEEASDGR